MFLKLKEKNIQIIGC